MKPDPFCIPAEFDAEIKRMVQKILGEFNGGNECGRPLPPRLSSPPARSQVSLKSASRDPLNELMALPTQENGDRSDEGQHTHQVPEDDFYRHLFAAR
jgi:hypothetical protein